MSRQKAGAGMAMAVPALPAWVILHFHHCPFPQVWTRSWRGDADGAVNPSSYWSSWKTKNKLTAANWE